MPKKKDKGRETLSGHNIVKFKTIKEKKIPVKETTGDVACPQNELRLTCNFSPSQEPDLKPIGLEFADQHQ